MGAGACIAGSREQLERTLNIRASLTTELWRPLLPAGRWQFCIFDEGKKWKTWGIRERLSCSYKYPGITGPFCPRLPLGKFHFLLNSQIYWGTLKVIIRQRAHLYFLPTDGINSSEPCCFFFFYPGMKVNDAANRRGLTLEAGLGNKSQPWKQTKSWQRTHWDWFVFSFINEKGQHLKK